MPERRLVPCLGPIVRGLHAGGGGDRADRPRMADSHSGSQMLVPALPVRSALRGRVRIRPQVRAKSATWAEPLRALALELTHPRQNMQVAAEEEQAGQPGRYPSFCGAVGARASICACQAFNTDTKARAICERTANHGRQLTEVRKAGPMYRTTFVFAPLTLRHLQDAYLLQWLLCPVRFPLPFRKKNTLR